MELKQNEWTNDCLSKHPLCVDVMGSEEHFVVDIERVVCLTLDLQVQDDLVRPKAVAAHTSVVPRILCFHRTNDEAAVAMCATPAVDHNRRRGSIAVTQVRLQ